MATNEVFDWRRSDRRVYLAIALIFPLIVLAGFGRTYYLKFAFDTPPVSSTLVHLHGLVMATWVIYFIAQVWLIRTKKHRVHMTAGLVGIALAAAILVVGFFTAAAAAKNGSPSTPPGVDRMQFAIVPFVDLVVFAILFGGAIYYRKRPANHKRLMAVTAISLLPPALARLPLPSLLALGPLYFFGVPTVIMIGLLIYDTVANKKLNKVFLAGSLLLIASYPIRLALMGTDWWASVIHWIISWAA